MRRWGIGLVALAVLVWVDPVTAATALPAVLWFAVLGLGRYPGERIVVALRRIALPARRRPRPSAPRLPRTTRVAFPVGSALLAFNRASRPPPGAALVS